MGSLLCLALILGAAMAIPMIPVYWTIRALLTKART